MAYPRGNSEFLVEEVFNQKDNQRKEKYNEAVQKSCKHEHRA